MIKRQQIYKVLSIAGFDGSGGAGLQADLKTFSALGCYGTTALTSLPVQNTTGVKAIYHIETKCVEEQIKAILDDIKIDAVKIGMLHRQDIIEAVAKILSDYDLQNIVLDPVMVAKSGDKLLLPDAIHSMQEKLFPLTTILTPNLMEASILLGKRIETYEEMEKAALELLKTGPRAVVVKGGHFQGDADDCLMYREHSEIKTHWFKAKRIETKNTHGTGCTFSAAIASFLARGYNILDAVAHAKKYLTKSIEDGADLTIGKGNGPVHHFHHLWDYLSSLEKTRLNNDYNTHSRSA